MSFELPYRPAASIGVWITLWALAFALALDPALLHAPRSLAPLLAAFAISAAVLWSELTFLSNFAGRFGRGLKVCGALFGGVVGLIAAHYRPGYALEAHGPTIAFSILLGALVGYGVGFALSPLANITSKRDGA